MVKRGEIWWADLPPAGGSEPGFTRPVLVIQSNAFNNSAISTVIVAIITSNLKRAQAPGNVLLLAKNSGLPKDSAVNVSQVIAIDRSILRDKAGQLSSQIMDRVSEGLKLVLNLQ